jgi:hypothetical protein
MATNRRVVTVGLSGCLVVVSGDIPVIGNFAWKFYLGISCAFLNDSTPGDHYAHGLDKLVYTQCGKGATTHHQLDTLVFPKDTR